MDRDGLEEAIRRLCDRQDFSRATALALEGYGPEILGFMVAALGDEQRGADAFSLLSEDVWRGIAGFRWQSTFRTWAYMLARHACARLRADPFARRRVGLEECPAVAEIADEVRTATLPYLRSEVKSRFARLRDALEPEDREVLILRVDRKLNWEEIAGVMLGPGAGHDHTALARKAGALRKQFERIKDRLRTLATRERLLEEG